MNIGKVLNRFKLLFEKDMNHVFHKDQERICDIFILSCENMYPCMFCIKNLQSVTCVLLSE